MPLDPRSVEIADVYRGDELAGAFHRLPRSTVFEYDPAFVARHAPHESGIASTLPYSIGRFESSASGVPTYFANLLPEGLRLCALRDRLKTSLADELSLLIAVGADPVGDVCVVPRGDPPWRPPVHLGAQTVEQEDFRELFRRSLAGEIEDMVLPGIQEKVSGSTVSFPIRGRGHGAHYILKLNALGKDTLVQNEAFFMAMARGCRLEAPATRVVTDRRGEPGLLVERFDRVYAGGSLARRLHVEDGCQVLDRYPGAKYEPSVRALVEGLISLVPAPGAEGVRLIRQIAFAYLIGNGDQHAKNLSLLWEPRRGVTISPAYDMLSTLPYHDRHMALKLEGRDQDWKRRDFHALAERLGIRRMAVDRALDRLCQDSLPWLDRLPEARFDARTTRYLRDTMRERRDHLS